MPYFRDSTYDDMMETFIFGARYSVEVQMKSTSFCHLFVRGKPGSPESSLFEIGDRMLKREGPPKARSVSPL